MAESITTPQANILDSFTNLTITESDTPTNLHAEIHLSLEETNTSFNNNRHFTSIHQGENVFNAATIKIASVNTNIQSAIELPELDIVIQIEDAVINFADFQLALAAPEITLISNLLTPENNAAEIVSDAIGSITIQVNDISTQNSAPYQFGQAGAFTINKPNIVLNGTSDEIIPITTSNALVNNDSKSKLIKFQVESEPFDIADAPILNVTNAFSLEDQAIKLDIQAALSDLDGSETLSITISGVPANATLSAGIDNGDGTWSLTANDLENLTITPPENFTGNIDLIIRAIATELNGETAETESNLTIVVDDVVDIFHGTNQNDIIFGTIGADIIYGKRGNDTLYGESGDDQIYGAHGNDVIYGGSGDDILRGGRGNDQLFGGEGDDIFLVRRNEDVNTSFDGGEGFDTIKTVGGKITFNNFDGQLSSIEAIDANNNRIDGTRSDNILDFRNVDLIDVTVIRGLNGKDIIYGSQGDDVVRGGNQNDTLYGEAGNDTLYGDNHHDILYGGSGDDILRGGRGNDQLFGGEGDDTFLVRRNEDVNTSFDGGEGFDTIKTVGGKITFNNFDGQLSSIEAIDANNNRIDGTRSDNILDFRNVDLIDVTVIRGLNGKDIIYGSQGDDVIRGGNQNDTLYGETGNDTLFGDNHHDILYGGSGDDILRGGRGNDQLFGDEGNDSLFGDNNNDTLRGGLGNDLLNGGRGNDIIYGGIGDDELIGGRHNDLFIFDENSGNDIVDGGASRNWTDKIQLNNADQDPSTQLQGQGSWVLQTNDSYTINNGKLVFDNNDASGTITLSDGNEINFTNIEEIEWT